MVPQIISNNEDHNINMPVGTFVEKDGKLKLTKSSDGKR